MAGKAATATASGLLSPAEVHAILDRGRAVLPGFTEAWPQAISYKATHRKALPALPRGLQIDGLYVSASLDARRVSPELVGRMLRLAAEALPSAGKFDCNASDGNAIGKDPAWRV